MIIRVKCRLIEENEIDGPDARRQAVAKVGSYTNPTYCLLDGMNVFRFSYEFAVRTLTISIESSVEKQTSYHLRAHCHQFLGEHQKTLTVLQWLTRYVPDNAHYYNMMAIALDALGRDEDGIEASRKSLNIVQTAFDTNATNENKEMLASSLNSLAWKLATTDIDSIRDANEAIKLAGQACDLNKGNFWGYVDQFTPSGTLFSESKAYQFVGNTWGYVDTLAAAYAASGDFDTAMKWQGKTLAAAPESMGAKDREGLEYRLDLYKKNIAYVDTESFLTLTHFKPRFSREKADVATRFKIRHPLGYHSSRRWEWTLRNDVGQFSENVYLPMMAIEQTTASGKFVCRSRSSSILTSGTIQRKSESGSIRGSNVHQNSFRNRLPTDITSKESYLLQRRCQISSSDRYKSLGSDTTSDPALSCLPFLGPPMNFIAHWSCLPMVFHYG